MVVKNKRFKRLHKSFPSHSKIYVCGTSGSMKHFPWHLLNNKVVVGLNDVIKIYPVNYHHFSDKGLYIYYKSLNLEDRTTAVVCRIESIRGLRFNKASFLDRLYRYDWSTRPTLRHTNRLFCRRTVALSGVELAWKLGADKIYLLGIDGCRPPGKNTYYVHGGASDWKKYLEPEESVSALCGKVKQLNTRGSLDKTCQLILEHRICLERRHLEWYEDFSTLRAFHDRIRSGLRIINLSPVSIFDQWERKDPWKHFGIRYEDWPVYG